MSISKFGASAQGKVCQAIPRAFPFASTAFAVACVLVTTAASAELPETTLHTFTGGFDGGRPDGNVVFDQNGAMYATTLWGGAAKAGVVFRLSPTGGGAYAETVLYTFRGGNDGGNPAAGLIFDSSGALYGTAQRSNGQLAGVVFRLTPPTSGGAWTYEVLYGFSGGADGGFPNCRLVFDNSGALIGTTTKGGAFAQGTVFRLSPPATTGAPWTESVLYSFGGADGAWPYAEVLQDSSGNLFGTTIRGGAFNYGTVYSLTPASPGVYTFQSLYSFTGGRDGGTPYAGVIMPKTGPLYGATFNGGTGYGTIFKLAPPAVAGGTWKPSVLHTFGLNDGGNPASTLAYLPATGLIYGTAFSVYGTGTLFALQPPTSVGNPWVEQVLFTFSGGSDGSNSLSTPVFDTAGNLYGTVYLGASSGAGAVFKLTQSLP